MANMHGVQRAREREYDQLGAIRLIFDQRNEARQRERWKVPPNRSLRRHCALRALPATRCGD